MKILQFINNLTSGGAEKLVYDLTLKLKEKGYKVDILLLFDMNNFYVNELKKLGVNVIVLTSNSKYSLFSLFKIIKIIKKNKYDVIHVHLFPALYYMGLIKIFFKNKKFIYTEHSTNNKRRSKFYIKFIERRIYSKYDKIVCISQQVEEKLKEFIGNSNTVVINNGIFLEKYRNANKISREKFLKIELLSNDKLLIMIGRFDLAKDQGTVIRALKLLPEKFKLILVGEGPTLDQNMKLVKSLKLEKRVFFLGVRKDIPELLKTSDVSILSSNWEGFGLVAVESMAAGIPLIGTNVEGLKQIINKSENLFEVGNEEELYRKILKITEDNNKNAYQEIDLKKYSINQMVDNYIQVYLL